MNNEIQGLNVDIIKSACEQANIQCDFELYPWKHALQKSLQTSNGGLISTAKTPKREALFQWVGPLASRQACFYKLKARKDIVITQRKDLLAYTAGLAREGVYEQVLKGWGFKEGKNYVTYSEKYAYSQAFKSNKLDLFIASSNTIFEHLRHLELNLEDIEPIYQISDPLLSGNFLAVNNRIDKALITKLQAKLDTLMNSEKLMRLKKKYIKFPNTMSKAMSEIERKCLI